nr:hypothetical protein [Tanacetum cinerariifolium]
SCIGSNHSGSGKNWTSSGNHITASGNFNSRGTSSRNISTASGNFGTPPDNTVAASMEVNTVAISFVSSLSLSAASSLTSNLLPLIRASSPDRSASLLSLSSKT